MSLIGGIAEHSVSDQVITQGAILGSFKGCEQLLLGEWCVSRSLLQDGLVNCFLPILMDFGQSGLGVRRKVGGGCSVGEELYEFGRLGVGVRVSGGSVGDTSDTFDALPEDFGLGLTI